jgi:O-antigen/teichoic acid export membrane protein
MLLANVLQRLVGLLRNLGFCRYLSDAELGQWAMANSFFVLAAPLAVLGLPGSFGKFVEIYRRQGALGNYLRALTLASGCGLAALATAMCLAPQSFAWLVFNDVQAAGCIGWIVATLAAVTVFNFVNELMSALRQVRVVSAMQFINSVGFALIAMAGLMWTQSWSVLLPSYTAACLLALLPGLWVLRQAHAQELRIAGPIDGMWQRIVPFAIALWCMNLLTNMFDVCDRTLLLHLTPGDAAHGQAVIGQYHCGRIIPNLLISVASLFSGILLPYLSADFESGDSQRLGKRLGQVLQIVALLFTVAAVVALAASSLLFDVTLGGRYAQAQRILPLALLQGIWMSLFLLAQTYLFCIERGKQVSLILALGLGLNLVLNVPMITHFGLAGSVAATALANGVILALVLWRIGREGQSLGWPTAISCFVPLGLVLGLAVGA